MKKAKEYYVNKNLILGTIALNGLTVSKFCKDLGIDRTNFYVALNKSYHAPRSIAIGRVIKALGLPESAVWSKE